MFKIAFCDADASAIQDAVNHLSLYATKKANFVYDVCSFHCAEDLLNQYVKGQTFDLLFLAIRLPDLDGIQAAKELRKLLYTGQIIFLTASSNHALEAFRVDATDYLLKPLAFEEFTSALDKFYQLMKGTLSRVFFIRSKGKDYKISPSHVIYAETKGHYQNIYLSNGKVLSVRSTLTDMKTELKEPYFIVLGRSYIINLQYVKQISSTSITLNDNTQLFPPRSSLQRLRQEYFDYYKD